MLVQLLHLIPKRFLTFSQHAQKWIFRIQLKLFATRKIVLLVLVSNLQEDQSAAVFAVHQALEVVSAVQCQERNEINHNRKENGDWHSRKFLCSSFFYSHQSLLQELEINDQLLRPYF